MSERLWFPEATEGWTIFPDVMPVTPAEIEVAALEEGLELEEAWAIALIAAHPDYSFNTNPFLNRYFSQVANVSNVVEVIIPPENEQLKAVYGMYN